ncbi:hypothetical protein J5X84_14220 [Streptosporangiaceae bacterium NEAU-GS5]|nr:hypothetical protein [Streptosporangiaceae bacterium NEAU-GS5]
MSWLALRRLRTGPTILVREKPAPDDLLEIVTLADPAAHREGDDIVLFGARIAARVELNGPELAKLSITDEEKLWALRVIAQGPQPVDYFDRLLAEGIAYRLEGWALTQGVLTDPAEDDPRDSRVYLPDLPDPAEFRAALSRLVAPVEEIGSSWPDNAELEDGLVHVPVRGEGQILYGGADVVVAGAWQKEMPSVVRARVPYAMEIVALTVKPFAHHEAEMAAEAADEPAEPTEPAEESDEAVEVVEAAETEAETEADTEAEAGEAAEADLVDTKPVALALAEAFNGVATDRWGFEITG